VGQWATEDRRRVHLPNRIVAVLASSVAPTALQHRAGWVAAGWHGQCGAEHCTCRVEQGGAASDAPHTKRLIP